MDLDGCGGVTGANRRPHLFHRNNKNFMWRGGAVTGDWVEGGYNRGVLGFKVFFM